MRIRPVFILLLLLCIINISTVLAQSPHPLLSAIKNNDFNQVSILLKQNTDINITDEDGDNVLMYATLYSTADCMKALLEKGANPNAKNKLQETALMWSSHDLEKIRILLEYKAEPNLKTLEGNTPFLSACVGASQSEIIRLMLQYGADPFVMNSRKETTLINIAILGDTADARIILNKGVNIDAVGFDGMTALFYAIRSGNATMANWLLDNKANPNQLDIYKSLPLAWAGIVGNMQLVKRILPLTTNINLHDIDSLTVLIWAAYSEYDRPDIIQALLDGGADPNSKDKKGRTALDWALKKGNTQTAMLLRKRTTIN